MFKPSELRAHLQRAEQLGYSPEQLMEGSGKAWSQIDSLEPMRYETIAGLFDLLAQRTPAGFAIRCGSMSRADDFGIVSSAMTSKYTLREAFQHWIRYSLLAGPPLIASIVEQGGEWSMRFRPRRTMTARGLQFCVEASIAAIESVIQDLTRQAPNTMRIEWPFRLAAIPDHYKTLRTPNFRFGMAEAVYIGQREDLDRPIPTRDGEVADMMDRQCERLLARIVASRPIEEDLEEYLLSCTGRVPSAQEAAKQFGLSRRSFQRALQERNLSYQSFVQLVRCDRAKSLLGERQFDVKQIAFEVGFQDVSSFRRAFREWTGQTVGSWVSAQCVATPLGSTGLRQPARIERLAHPPLA
jgi:AraC-like DNA-binding protein